MSKAKNPDKKSLLNIIIDGISEIFMPVVGLLSAAGILKGLMLILVSCGVLAESDSTYAVLNAISDSLFYFLPIILADTSARKFGANPYMAMVVAGALLYPALVTLMLKNSSISFMGLPIRSVTYSSSVFPIIMAVAMLAWLEKLLVRRLPEVVRGFMLPIISLVLVTLATLFVFGPIGSFIGDGFAIAYDFIYSLSPVAAGIVLGAAIQIMVLFGFHWSIIIIAMNNIALNGCDTILALIGPAIFAQAGAALGVMLKIKGNTPEAKKFRSVCITGIISAILGVTEPAMFGVNLPKKKPMIAVCFGGGLGGAIVGLSGAQAKAFAFPSLASFPVYFGEGFGVFILGCAVGLVAAFIMSMILKYDTTVAAEAEG